MELGHAARRLNEVGREEIGALDLRRSVALAFVRLLPPLVGNRLRAVALRLGGIQVGAGTTVGGRMTVLGPARLTIGRRCWINAGCQFDVSAPITIGDGVSLAHEVLMLTNSHEIGDPEARAADLVSAPIVVGDGCWLGARAIVLPGVTIGAGSIVAAGAVVIADIEPNTVVGGVPARVLRRLDDRS